MQEVDYTFVTLDNEDVLPSDAVIIDMESNIEMPEIVMIDDGMHEINDFISLSDDTVMLSNDDVLDMYSIDFNDQDIAFML